ncbi:MAG: hypothetical protein HC780_08380 [Leptolyngbyaceae cyanobacterium CSU_1_3]|nr:hypothetical protein [Leptolyngbyaceae cyanobacterium CSU_1_3]
MLLFVKPPSFWSKRSFEMPDDFSDDELQKRLQSKIKNDRQRQNQCIQTLRDIRQKHSLERRLFF